MAPGADHGRKHETGGEIFSLVDIRGLDNGPITEAQPYALSYATLPRVIERVYNGDWLKYNSSKYDLVEEVGLEPTKT